MLQVGEFIRGMLVAGLLRGLFESTFMLGHYLAVYCERLHFQGKMHALTFYSFWESLHIGAMNVLLSTWKSRSQVRSPINSLQGYVFLWFYFVLMMITCSKRKNWPNVIWPMMTTLRTANGLENQRIQIALIQKLFTSDSF